MNKVILKGNLTRDPDVKVVGKSDKQTSVANFTLAMSRHFRTAGGEKRQDTTFIDCEAWDKNAETIGKFLVKGSPLLLEGSLKQDTWEKDGQKHSKIRVRVITFELLGGKRNGDQPTPTAEPTAEPAVEPAVELATEPAATQSGSDDVPFEG